MVITDVNYLAVLVAAIVAMIIGFVWYSKSVFGKQWMELMGLTEKKLKSKNKGMGGIFAVAFVATLVMSFVLANILNFIGATTLAHGALTGFLIWLGFVTPVLLGSVLWEGKHINFFFINIGHYLVTLIVMGSILAVWS